MTAHERQQTRIAIVGAGRLGASLAAALVASRYRVTAVTSRSIARAQEVVAALDGAALATTEPEQALSVADIVFLTVQDGVIGPLTDDLRWRKGQSVVHCSGALGLDVLGAAAKAGAEVGCLHPLQSFPSRTPEPERFRGVYCGIEASGEMGDLLEQITIDLGSQPLRLDGADRALYHAAAVFASNYVVALMAAARRTWELAGLPPETARPALAPLLRAVAANVSKSELGQALTGPIARGDAGTVERHLRALADEADLNELYRRLGTELLTLSPEIGGQGRSQLQDLLRG